MATNKVNRVLALLFLSLFALTSCFSQRTYMSHQTYDSIKTGSSVADLTNQVGKPYAMHAKEDGSVEYEYIERIDNGITIVAENHYFIIVQDNEVVGKYMTRETPPAYDLIYQEEPNYPGYPSGS
ncbi:MAG: hypothetical protein V4492_06335 [Chlamydiota bacterium]